MEEKMKKELREAVMNLTSARSKFFDVDPTIGSLTMVASKNDLQPLADDLGEVLHKLDEIQDEMKEAFKIVSEIYYVEKGKTKEEAEELTRRLNFEGVVNKGLKDAEKLLKNIDKEPDE